MGLTVRTALSVTIASLLAARASALTIIPIWGSSITSDPNAARIEADINNVITSFYQANFSNNVTLTVNISENGSISGAYNVPNMITENYAPTILALQSHASTLDNVAMLSKVSAVAGSSPLSGAPNSFLFSMEQGLAAALGLTTNSVTTGSIVLGLTSGGAVDDNYVKQLFGHEMDEEMGTISGSGFTPNVIDLTRYSAAGIRSYTTSTSEHAYFSPDGVNMGPEYFQYFANGIHPGNYDYGDFNSPNFVQGYGTGAFIPTVERRMLNVAGWTYTGPTVMNQTTNSPNTLVTLPISTVSTAGGVIPNASGNDVQIIQGGAGTVTLAGATTMVNTLVNTATTTAVTVNLAGQQLVAGNGAVDAGAGLIEIGTGATSMTIGSAVNDGTVTAGTSGAYALGLISANASSTLDIKSAIVNNAGGGAVSLITLNIGTVILEGTNTYTGTTTVGGGSTLQVGNGGTTGNLGAGNVEIDGTLKFNRSSATTVAGSLSGAGSLIQAGTGTTILAGATSTFTGSVSILAGATLQVGAGAATGDLGSVTIANSGTLVFNRSDNFVVNNTINGTGSLTQAGTGTLTLKSTPIYTGGTTVQSGTLQIVGGASLGAGSYTVASGAVLEYSSLNAATYAGVITGAGGFTKDTGGVTLTFTGANTYTGATTINAGTLTLNFSAVGAPTSNILASSSTLVMGDGKLIFTGTSGKTLTQTFAGTTFTAAQASLTLSQGGATGFDVNLGPITFNAASAASFAGATGSVVGARFLTTTGSANAMLAPGVMYNGTDWAAKDATNTYIVAYTGYSDIYTGTTGSKSVIVPNTAAADVRLQENSTTGAPNTLASATTTINSLLMNAAFSASTIAMSNGALTINGGANAIGGVAVGASAKTLTIGSAANDGSITAGASGASTLLLVANNGSSSLIVNSIIRDNAGGGVVTLGVSGGSGGGTVTVNGTNTFSGNVEITSGTLQIAGAGTLGSGNYSGAIISGGALRYSSSATQTISGVISGGSLTKDTSASTLILTGVNTYTGSTTISAGTLEISGSGVLGGGNYGNLISGAGAFIYNSTATQILSAPNSSFTGNFTISAGILKITANTALGGTNLGVSRLSVTSGGTLDLNGVVGALLYGITISGSGSAGQGALINSGSSTSSSNAQMPNITLGGNASIGGSGDFYEIATGNAANTLDLAGFTLTKTGTNTFWLDNTTVTAGTIRVSGGIFAQYQASNASAAAFILDNTAGATLSLGSFSMAVGSLSGGGANGGGVSVIGTLTVGALNASTTYAGAITGPGGVVLTGTGVLALTGANTYAGSTAINSGTLSFAAGALSSTSSVLMKGGTLQWNGTNTQDISSRISMVNATTATFDTNGNTLTLASDVGASTSGSLVKAGAGVLILTAAESYTGTTTVATGTLQLGSASGIGTLAGGGGVTVNAGATLAFGQAGAVTIANAISGPGALAQKGTGTTTLSGTSAFAGAVTVNSGTLVVTGSISGSATTVQTGAVLAGTGALAAVTVQSGGTVQPGAVAAPGLLSTGNFSLLSGGHLSLELGGITGTGTSATAYSEANVTGTVSLAGDVQISLFNGYTPNIGDTFYILLNDGSDAIAGSFSNATGGLLIAGGIQYHVDYQASGNGGANDVSLTVLAIPEPATGLLALSGFALGAGMPRFRRKNAARRAGSNA